VKVVGLLVIMTIIPGACPFLLSGFPLTANVSNIIEMSSSAGKKPAMNKYRAKHNRNHNFTKVMQLAKEP
jgi:hypothetical protein